MRYMETVLLKIAECDNLHGLFHSLHTIKLTALQVFYFLKDMKLYDDSGFCKQDIEFLITDLDTSELTRQLEYSGTPYEPGENVASSDPTVPEIPVVDSIPIQPANSDYQDSLVVIKCTHGDCAKTFRDKKYIYTSSILPHKRFCGVEHTSPCK